MPADVSGLLRAAPRRLAIAAGIMPILLLFLAACPQSTDARNLTAPTRRRPLARHKSPPPFRSEILVEAKTGKVLRAVNPRLRIIPASITKTMTTLLVLEHLRDKKVRLDDVVTVSRRASKVGGQQVYLAQGEQFTLEQLMKAVMITSANDAAYAVAEYLAGDVHTFVKWMNRRARELGMTDTRFVNVNGLPPRRGKPDNRMSARDASILARELLKYPLVLKWTSTPSTTFRNGKFILTNTNRLLGHVRGLDGLKTGYYHKAGFSIIATAKRANLRLIAIVFGSPRSRTRFNEARKLLSWGFNRYRWVEFGKEAPDGVHQIRVLKGRKAVVPLETQGTVRALVQRGEERHIAAHAVLPDTITAPVREGQQVGRIVYELEGNEIGEVRLVASEPVERVGFFKSFIRLQ